jgi:hypothetical protein
MTARRRTTFDKLQKERARREKQAAKRARRQAKRTEGPITDGANPEPAPPGSNHDDTGLSR